MVYINGNFEPCSTEEDIINICKEYVNNEFAYVVQEKFYRLEQEKEEAQNPDIKAIANQLVDIANKLSTMEE